MRDDGTVPDVGKRLAQELVVDEKVQFLGAGSTPTALSMAPIVTEAKVPGVIMISGASIATERSPYYVRTSFTLGQQAGIIADWAIKNGSKKAVMVLTDWTPSAEAAKVFQENFTKGGGQVLDYIKVPLANPDFAPFLQRARDLQPDTLFVFVPASQAGTFPGNLPNAGSINPASRWSAPEMSLTITICPVAAMLCSASSPPVFIQPRIPRR